MMVLGGIIAARYMPNVPDPYRWFLFLPVATIALGVVMTMQGYITLLPLRSSVEQHSWLVSTLAVSVLIGAVILLIQGNSQILTTSQFPSFPVLGTRTPAPYLMAIILALIWYVVLRWFHSSTLTGSVDQRGCAGSRRRTRGRPTRAAVANAGVLHQRIDHWLDRVYRGADPRARER